MRVRLALTIVVSLIVACTTVACTTAPEPKQDKTPPAPEAKPEGSPAKSSRNQKRSSEACVGPLTDAPVKTLSIAGHDWQLSGSTLTEKTHDPDESVAVGVVADLKEDTPENLTNIDKFVNFFRQEKVEFIFVDGDTGETKSQVANNLKRLAQSGLPVGIIIGNRECETDFTQAVDEVAAKMNNVFNLNRVRHIVMDDAEFVTLPGYYNPAYLHCMQKGCQYFDEDLQALGPIVDKAAHPMTLVSHGPPRQHAPTGIDRISEGTNEGDPLLAKFMRDHQVPFGLFANIHEAGGHATDLGGDNLVRENIIVDSLYLNPGPGDSVRWQMNDSTESVGMAAVVTYKGKQASYRMFRIGQGAKKR
jgi:Icc-related predicted phosphoesterase